SNGSQVGFDKKADALLARLDKLENEMKQTQTTFGGQSASQMQKKMAGMTQQEKIAYVMQMTQQMEKDRMAAYTGAQGQALVQSQQRDMTIKPKEMTSLKAEREMSETDAEYDKKFSALYDKMLAQVKTCPIQTIGESSGPNRACTQAILDQYKKDYDALAEKKMARYASIYVEFRKTSAKEIKDWAQDINALKSGTSEAARDEIRRKKTMIYLLLKALTDPADKMVDFGYETSQMDPWKVCGGNCMID
ncbi:MAG: hypothetical protein ACREL1_04805, partial [bacterium]